MYRFICILAYYYCFWLELPDSIHNYYYLLGKTKILRSLNKTYSNMKRKPLWQDLNPKAVTNDELFGFINPATREWRDG